MPTNYKRITKIDRYKIEALYNRGCTVQEIADEIRKTIYAVYYELRKGYYMHLNTDYTYTKKYSADKAQQKTDFNATTKRPPLKIGNDHEYCKTIEHLIKDKKLSPAAALATIENEKIPCKTKICRATLYNYIHAGIFLCVKRTDLVRKPKRKRKSHRSAKSAPRGTSIEYRPDHIQSRKEFGHWEFDTVVGKQKKAPVLLVATERKTNYEIIVKIPDKTALSVVRAINTIERRFGRAFSEIFKTITVDNGTEFSNTQGMEKSIYRKRPRTKVYYCHPYSSWERGSNENANGIIRRFIPKGTDMRNYSRQYIQKVEDYLNDLPREKHNYQTANTLFANALSNLGIKYF